LKARSETTDRAFLFISHVMPCPVADLAPVASPSSYTRGHPETDRSSPCRGRGAKPGAKRSAAPGNAPPQLAGWRPAAGTLGCGAIVPGSHRPSACPSGGDATRGGAALCSGLRSPGPSGRRRVLVAANASSCASRARGV